MARELTAGLYGLNALRVGDWLKTAPRLISPELIDAFSDLSGDRFAIHMDDEAAHARGFPARVAHGLLILSVVDGLKNQTPPQFNAIASLSWDWRFDAPVFAGDTISATLTVENLRKSTKPDRGVATLRQEVHNQDSQLVQSGQNKLMLYA